MTQATYVVIGAGSAGCVLANRLSADPQNTVYLLEAGGWDRSPWIHIPVGYFRTMLDPKLDWGLKTQPDPALNGRSISWPRGKVIGGSSSLNGLLYVRGQAEDYDRWAQMGNRGWSWDDVLPLFKSAENFERESNEARGQGGELNVADIKVQRPIVDAWVESAIAAGYKANSDYNSGDQEGVGYFQTTTRKGLRCSSAVAFLHPVKKRPNLHVVTNVRQLRLVVDDKRATGVSFVDKRGTAQHIQVSKEIVLSAGAIGSPQILMTSGIGESDHLNDHGIKPVHHMSQVGKGLQDHLQARLVYKTKEATLNDEVHGFFQQARIAAEYALRRTGPMTMAASLGVAFLKTDEALATPDIQFHIQPWSADSPGEGAHRFSAFTASVCQLRPESRGQILLNSSDPDDKPLMEPNYLATETDRRTIVGGIRVAMKVAAMDPLKSKISEHFRPTLDVQSDAEILEWARQNSTTIYHQTGTCRMGQDDEAVVDERLRVKGIAGLRVADASIMPEIISGNTNAPSIMIGEKASQMILEDQA